MSRCVRGMPPLRPPPAPLIAPSDARMPSSIGRASVISVQMAAMPMVPAPIKRTCVLHTVVPKACSVAPSGRGVMAVSQGTATPQVSSSPSSMASPPTMPTR
ncbi:hypothetical protein D3C72_2184700 [compost metagenome]